MSDIACRCPIRSVTWAPPVTLSTRFGGRGGSSDLSGATFAKEALLSGAAHAAALPRPTHPVHGATELVLTRE